MMAPEGTPLLAVRDLTVEATVGERWVRLIDNVSFDVQAHEVLGVVGESGSGKSITMLAVMGLLPYSGPNRRRANHAWRTGFDQAFVRSDARDSRSPHGDDLPRPDDIIEPGVADRRPDRRDHSAASACHVIGENSRRIVELLELVGIPDAARRAQISSRTHFPAECGSAP